MSGQGSPAEQLVDGHGLRIAVVAARWHEQVSNALLKGAERALATLRKNVVQFEHRGAISDADGAAILRAADTVQTRLVLITTTTTTTTTSPPPPEPDPGQNDKHGRKHGHHKGDDNGD